MNASLSKTILRWLLWGAIVGGISSLFVTNVTFASTVKVCRKIKQSRHVDRERLRKKSRKIYCSIKPKMGNVGDSVEIKNQYNYIVAVGRIVKQGKSSTIIRLMKYDPEVGSMAGYPAMVRDNDNQYFWTATTAPF